MKSFKTISAALILVMLTCSCDFVRSALGKPTSADIERLRRIKASQEKAYQDSILQERLLQEALQAELEKKEASRLHRYNISAGTFTDSLNAENLCAAIKESGYDASVYRYVSGTRFAVLVAGYDDQAEAASRLHILMTDPDFKYDICIFDAQREIDKIQKQTIIQQQ